ncbi:MAG: DUF4838 domain-containing protein [bacterium]
MNSGILSLVVAGSVLGAGCASVKPGSTAGAAAPRDLSPVSWRPAPAHAPVVIVRDGTPQAVVFVATAAPGKALDGMVRELMEVVRLSTGAALERVTEPPARDQAAIIIGDCEETRRAGIDAKQIPIEGFVVKTARHRVYLVGSTQTVMPGVEMTGDGTAWAVADFLERFAGVRWYWPTEVGGRTLVTSASLVIPPVHYSDQPVFRQREYEPMQGWKLPTTARPDDKTPIPFAEGAIPDGVQHIDIAGYLPLVRAGCSWPYKVKCHEPQNLVRRFSQEFREKNPDLFALKPDGTRNEKMFCYSSQKTLDYLLTGCEARWDGKKGDASWVTASCVTVSPCDSKVECHCPACLETIAKAGGTPIDGASLVMGLFVQRLCEAVKQRWPDKKVIYLSYWNYDTCPPGVEYPDNLTVMSAMTTYPMTLNAQRANLDEAIERLKAWRSKTSIPVTAWDYCVAWTYGPHQYPHVVRDWHQALRGTVAGVFINGWKLSEWTTTAPTMYVWMKSLWNPELDVDAVLDEMCRRLYGPAGDTARAMIRLECDLWESGAWQSERVKIPGGWYVPKELFPRVWTPAIVERLKALRDQALVELADDPVARQRFLYWTWTFDAFLRDAEAAAGGRLDDPGR